MIFVYLIIALVFLVWSGGALVSTLTRLSGRFKVSFFVISFLMMAGATSVPELFVAIQSAFDNETALAFGVVVGSNIADIALVLGTLLILNPQIQISSSIKRFDSVAMAFVAIVPFILIIDRNLSRIDGVILIIVFALYLFNLLQSSKFFKKIQHTEKSPHLLKDIIVFILAVVTLLISSHYVVLYSTEVASFLRLPVMLVGLILVSLGTSLPELVFAYRASKEKKPELSLGDITGSVVFNAALILGVAAIISPFELASPLNYLIPAIFTAILFAYFIIGVINEKALRKPFGFVLVAFYISFIILELI